MAKSMQTRQTTSSLWDAFDSENGNKTQEPVESAVHIVFTLL
jgi:hypothetical protein